MIFHRKFSKNMYKNQKILLEEMSFFKDFLHTNRGDLYPLLNETETAATPETETERIHENKYSFQNAAGICRLLGQFFPFATYEMNFEMLQGQAGFLFTLPSAQAVVLLKKQSCPSSSELSLEFSCKNGTLQKTSTETFPISDEFTSGMSILVTCRPGAFDVYLKKANHVCFVKSFETETFQSSNNHSVFSNATAAVLVEGSGTLNEVAAYMDCGISQADIRPVRYENGDLYLENGKIYLTMSIRMEKGCYQGIFSWIPGTAEFQLTGALFFDAGDGRWGNDVASSLLYHRAEKKWYLWVCSFSHDHILGHAAFTGDVRFGVNVVDITLMEKAAPEEPLTVFKGYEGDEDPDFIFDEETGRWLMAICRLDPSIGGYRYYFYESEHPFEGYRNIGQGQDGAETGGSFVWINGELCFCCGNSFELRANYRLYSKSGMQNLKCDYDDGGFRGWGTIIPVPLGSRTRYFWLTFDRHNGSDYNWSYGNIYCFEATFAD